MKGKQFAKQFMEGADCFPEFDVVARAGPDGTEEPVKAIKVRGGRIVLELPPLPAAVAWQPPKVSVPAVPPPAAPASIVTVDDDSIRDATRILAKGLRTVLPGTAEALEESGSLDALETAAVRAIAALLARADSLHEAA